MIKICRKQINQIVASFMAALFLFCGILPNQQLALAAESNIKYVALGDSIVAGYGLKGYKEGLHVPAPEDSYQALVANSLHTTSINDAITGITSDELIELLGKKNVKKDLKNADYITISIGSNDLLGPFIGSILQFLQVDTLEDIAKKVNEVFQSNDINLITEFISQVIGGVSNNEEFHKAATDYSDKLAKILKLVRKQAPDAKLYITNIYNPYSTLTNDFFPLGTCAEVYISEMNQAFDTDSEEYTLIDAHSAFADGTKVNVKFNLLDLASMNMDPHPNKEGHRTLADLIIQAMNQPTVSIPAIKSISSKKINQISLKLKTVEDADGYEIWCSTSKDGTYQLLKDTTKATVTINSKKLKAGKTYYVKIVAYQKLSGVKTNKTESSVKKVVISNAY